MGELLQITVEYHYNFRCFSKCVFVPCFGKLNDIANAFAYIGHIHGFYEQKKIHVITSIETSRVCHVTTLFGLCRSHFIRLVDLATKL